MVPDPRRRGARPARARGARRGVRGRGCCASSGCSRRSPTRAGYRQPVASDFQRELIVEEAVRRAKLARARASRRPSRASRAPRRRFVTELGRARWWSPPRLTSALRQWAGGGPRRALRRRGRGRSTRPTASGLEAAGLVDEELFAWRALDALRAGPGGLGRHPAVRLRVRRLRPASAGCARDAARGARRRDGLAAVRARAPRVQGGRDVRTGAARARRRGARARRRSTTTTPPSRAAALHHVERCCSRTSRPSGRRRRRDLASTRPAASAPRWSSRPPRCSSCSASGDARRATWRSCSATRRATRRCVEQVFGAYGIPYSIDRRLPLRPHRARPRPARADPLRRGRRARPTTCSPISARPACSSMPGARGPARGGRAPGGRARPPSRRARSGSATAGSSRSSTGSRGARDTAALRRASSSAPRARCSPAPTSAARARAERRPSSRRRARFARGRRRRSESCAPCSAASALDAGARAAACWSSSRCTWASARSPTACRWPRPRRSARAASRRCSCCGLQEGEFPRGASPEPFLSDEDRRAIATASGLVLPVREDRLDRERYLFYVCASRAERLLVLSSRSSDEEGNPQAELVLRGRRARPARRRRRARARARSPT